MPEVSATVSTAQNTRNRKDDQKRFIIPPDSVYPDPKVPSSVPSGMQAIAYPAHRFHHVRPGSQLLT